MMAVEPGSEVRLDGRSEGPSERWCLGKVATTRKSDFGWDVFGVCLLPPFTSLLHSGLTAALHMKVLPSLGSPSETVVGGNIGKKLDCGDRR